MPGPGFVVVQPKLGLGHLKSVLDRPAMTLHRDQCLDRRAGRTPGREIGHLAITDAAPDQQAAGPQAARRWRSNSAASRSASSRYAQSYSRGPLVPSPADRRRQAEGSSPLGNVFGGAADQRLADPTSGTGGLNSPPAHNPCRPCAAPSPPRRRRRRCQPPPRRMARRAAMARSIIRTPSCGLVAKRTSQGTCAAASRAASVVHSFGRYSARSMKAWPWRET